MSLPVSRVRLRTIIYLLIFLATCALMAGTGNVIIVGTWVLIWVFATYFATRTRGSEFVAFWLGFQLFYPVVASDYSDLQEAAVVQAAILVVFAIVYARSIVERLRAHRLLLVVVAGWVAWGAAAYAPVLADWAGWSWLLLSDGTPSRVIYGDVPSVIKTAAPIITSVLVAVMMPLGLARISDLRAFRRAVLAGLAVLLLLSFAQWAVGTRFVVSEYPEWPGRMVGYSIPDANGFGRLLLMPSLLLLGGLLVHRASGRAATWAVVLVAVVAIVLTKSRTTYVSFATGVLALSLLNLRRGVTYAVAASLAGTAIVAAITFGVVPDFLFGGERLSPAHVEGRLLLYVAAISIVTTMPWFGALPGGYAVALTEAGYTEKLVGQHSMLLAIAVEWGVPMALVFVAAGVAAVVCASAALARAGRLNADGDEVAGVARAMIALVVAYFVHGLTEVVSPDMFFLVVGISFALWCHVRRASSSAASRPGPVLGTLSRVP